jgi:GntR family transcriptional regulator
MSERPTTPHIPIHISMDDPEPIYAQIESQLRDFILSGALPPGTGLPSVRALAADATCSVLTARRAYDDLEREGLIRTRHGVGSVVADISEEDIRAHRREPAAAAFREGVLLGRRAGLTEEELRDTIEEALRAEETDVHRGGST